MSRTFIILSVDNCWVMDLDGYRRPSGLRIAQIKLSWPPAAGVDGRFATKASKQSD